MAEPMTQEERERARRARAYLDTLLPASVDVEVGSARIEPEPSEADIPASWRLPPRVRESAEDRTARLVAEAERRQTRMPASAPSARISPEAEQAARDVVARRDARRRAYQRSWREGIEGDIMEAADEAEALAQGTAQGVTLGFYDEAGGALRALLGDETYEQGRNALRRRRDEARRQAPGTYSGGVALGGALPALLVPGPGAATASGRVLQAGGIGAGFGAVEGLGSSDAATPGEMAVDTAIGGGIGGVLGAGGQVSAEALDAARRYLSGIGREGARAPRAGADFTREQRAAIDADPQAARLAHERDVLERQAAARRVLNAAPEASPADLERIEATYPGGIRGLARDMDESGIAGRRSFDPSDAVRTRAEQAARGVQVRPGTLPDDEHVIGTARTAASDSPRQPIASDLPRDPADDVPVGETWEEQLRAMREEDPANWRAHLEADARARAAGRRLLGEGPMEIVPDAPAQATQRAAPDAGTAPRGAGRRRPRQASASDDADILDFSVEAMYPRQTTQYVEPDEDALSAALAQERPALRWRSPSQPSQPSPSPARADEPIDFAMMDAPEPRATGSGPLSDEHDARVRANILAAERRARRGGYSASTHDERTWPVDLSRVEDITPAPQPAQAPQAAPARPTATPPPLPRRAAPAVDVGRWDAPAPASVDVTITPGQRAGAVLDELGRRGDIARAARGTSGTWGERGQRAVEDFVIDRVLGLRGRGHAAMATVDAARADAIAERVMARIAPRAVQVLEERGLRRAAAEVAALMTRAPRDVGPALRAYLTQAPELESMVSEETRRALDEADALASDPAGGLGGPTERAPIDDEEQDVDPDDPAGGF